MGLEMKEMGIWDAVACNEAMEEDSREGVAIGEPVEEGS